MLHFAKTLPSFEMHVTFIFACAQFLEFGILIFLFQIGLVLFYFLRHKQGDKYISKQIDYFTHISIIFLMSCLCLDTR